MSSVEPSAPGPTVVERYHRTPVESRDPLSRLARRIPSGATALDVGTATGALATLLAARGCIVDGIERDVGAAMIARPGYRRFVVADLDLSELSQLLPPTGYDFIVFADVLEHLREPERVLRSCRQLLAPGGRVLLSMPNLTFAPLLAELLAGRFAYRVSGLLDRTHLRLWTLSSLHQLAAAAGFGVRELEAIERLPHEAEFDTRYMEVLPQEVSAFLRSVPGAATYQWLLELATGEDAAAFAVPRLAAPERFEVRFPISLLWRSRVEGFDRSRQATAYARVCAGRQQVELALPADLGEVDGLALELACRAATFEMHEMRLYGRDGRLQWTLDSAHLARLTWHGAVLAVGDPGGVLLACSARGASLELPSAVAEGVLGGSRLVVDLDWPEAAEVVPGLARLEERLALVAELQQQVQELRGGRDPAGPSETAELRRAVDSLAADRGRELTAWEEERDRLGSQLMELARELASAAAQRDAQELLAAQSRADCATLRVQVEVLTSERDAARTQTEASRHEFASERAAFRDRLETLSSERSSLNDQVSLAASEAAALRAQVERLDADLAAQRSHVSWLLSERAWMTSTAAWRWRERLVRRPRFAALYRLLKRS